MTVSFIIINMNNSSWPLWLTDHLNKPKKVWCWVAENVKLVARKEIGYLQSEIYTHGNDLWSQANCIFDVCEKNVSIISDKKEIVYIPENSSACISIKVM